MRNALFISMAAMIATAGPATGTNVNIRFEARGLGSSVAWSDISGGFMLDVFLESETNMEAAQLSLTGDPGFQHAGTVRGGGEGILNYESDQGWDRANGVSFAAGSLPLPGNVLGTIAADTTVGARSGRFAWLEFTAVPPDGDYEITVGSDNSVGGMDFQNMTIASITPLKITGSGGGGGGGDDGTGGDDGGAGTGDDGSGDGSVTPDDNPGGTGDGASDGTGTGGGTGDNGGDGMGPGADDGGQSGNGSDDSETIAPPPLCALGVVEAACWSALALFFAQRSRRR